MFKTSSLPYLKAISLIQGVAADRLFVGAAAVAATIVECLDLPTAPLSAPAEYYNQHFGMIVRDQISTFNEAATIDTTRCLELCRKFWMFRYNTLYGASPYIGVEGDFFCGYMQCNLQFSPEDAELLDKYAVQIATLQNQIRLMIDRDQSKKEMTPSVVKIESTEITDRATIVY